MPKKKIVYISAGLAIVFLIFGYVFLFNRLTDKKIEISEYDFIVVADSYDNCGVDLNSGFTITSDEDYELVDVKNIIKVSPEIDYTIKKSGYGTYYLKPKSDLQDDSIYNIYVENDQNVVLDSWAFQTKGAFNVVSTLPANDEVCTDLSTGIQINFSKKIDKIDNYFEITPQIDGNFIYTGKSVTFVPDEKLTDGEKYTVKIKAGLQSIDKERLEEDYEFSFKAEEYYYFSQRIELVDSRVNFTSKDIPVVAFKYGQKDFSNENFNINVYDLLSYNKYLELTHVDDVSNLDDYDLFTSFSSKLIYDTDNDTVFIYYPSELPIGWYLVDITTENENYHLQQLVQISDIVVYIQSLNGQALIWCNDVETGLSLNNINISVGDKKLKTNENGVVIFEITGENEVIITSNEGKCFADLVDFDSDWEDTDYNIYLYTDRESYLPTDTINYWGMIVPQNSTSKLPKTIGVYLEDRLVDNEVSVNSNGIFTGSFDITNHLSTYTSIDLGINDEICYGKSIVIQEYIKPMYVLDFTFDKEYYRKSDIANIDVKGTYFDGNPASMLQLNLNIGSDTESIELNQMGEESIQYAVNSIYKNSWQGAYVYASLQTSGDDEDAGTWNNFLYFPTDYALETDVSDGALTIKTNLIDFSKLDVNDINYDKLMGEPQSGIYGYINIYRTDYIKKEVGTYYDFINKVNKPKYEYDVNKVLIDTINFTTNSDGIFKIPVEYEALEDSYYSFEVNYTMPDGFSGFQNGTISNYDYIQENTYYYFDTGYEQLKTDEEVLVKVASSGDFVNNGRVIYSVLNEQLQEVALTKNTQFKLKFKEEYIPNVLLLGAYFDGSNIYRINPVNLYYDTDEKALDISITTDKEEYEPGDTVKINVEAKDKFGKSARTNMVISVVDEAAFAVNEQYTYPLYSLYEYEYYEPMTYYSSSLYNDIGGEGGGGGGDSGDYREFFKDTAAFLTIKTGSNGKTSASFELPDNITSWRITVVGITESLKAGVNTKNVSVTLPFYTNAVMNQKYNISDDITLNLKSSGSSLPLINNSIQYTVNLIKDDEIVNSEVKYQLPFKSVNVNLGKAPSPGRYKVEVKSVCGVYKDTFVKEFTVENSLHEINIIKDIELNEELNIEALKYPVSLIIYDIDNNQYYEAVKKVLQGSIGNTAEQKIAYNILAKKLNNLNENIQLEEVELQSIQKYDGGVSLLSYAESDALLTAKICALAPEYIDIYEAEKYFEMILGDENSAVEEVTAAYFGLATLKKPVLNDIIYLLENNSNLSIQDKLNLIAGLSYIGDYNGANGWYEKLIQPRLRESDETLHIYSYDKYEDYSTTSFLTMILAKINHSDFEKVVEYIINNDSKEYTSVLDLVEYIKSYNPNTDSNGYIKFTDGETEQIINFNGINTLVLKFDEKELKKFKILETSNLTAKAIYTGTFDEARNLFDDTIYIKKDISNESSIGEMRTVTLTIKLYGTANSFDDIIINDIVPSGMRFVGAKDLYNYSNNAQKVQFRIDTAELKNEYIIKYNVRNVLQGEYAVESAIIMNQTTNEIGFTEEGTIVIE